MISLPRIPPQNIKSDLLNWMSTFLRYTLLVKAVSYILIYFHMVFFRIQYPFELEWGEGIALEQIRRIVAGQKIYVSPSLAFIAYPYPPLYFYVSAIVSNFTGLGFMPLRLVSFISSLGCFFIIFLIVKQETNSIYFGILASSLFAATFRIGGAWFDIARVDSLYLLFLLAALYLIRFKTSITAYVLAGVLMSFSFLTKQTALAISLPVMVYAIVVDWRRAIFFTGTFVTIIVGSTWFLDYIHSGWYSFYIFELPSHTISRIVRHRWVSFWSQDIMLPLAIAFSLSIFFVSAKLFESKRSSFFYLSVAVGTFGVAWLARLPIGGYENNLLPAYVVISILFGLAGHKVFDLIQGLPKDKQSLMRSYIYLIYLIQFFVLIFNPLAQIPTQQDLEAGKRSLDKLAQIEGDIFLPYHSYLPALVGKRSFAHQMSIWDIFGGGEKSVKTKLADEIRQAIAAKRFGAIILDQDGWFSGYLEKYYEKQGYFFDNATVFWPVTGWTTRPEFVYIPKVDAANGRIPSIDAASFSQKLRLVNPTERPYVYAYIWNNGQTETYLLDDASRWGNKYDVEWIITPGQIWFRGPHKEHQSSIIVLSPDQYLAVAVAFSDDSFRTTQNIFERRFWFKFTKDDQIEVSFPPEEWHNPHWPDQSTWRMVDIDHVMADR